MGYTEKPMGEAWDEGSRKCAFQRDDSENPVVTWCTTQMDLKLTGAAEPPLQQSALAALAEDQGLVLSTHPVAPNKLVSGAEVLVASLSTAKTRCTYKSLFKSSDKMPGQSNSTCCASPGL